MTTRRSPTPIRLRRRHQAAPRPSDAAPAAGVERRAAARAGASPGNIAAARPAASPGNIAASRRRRVDTPQDRAVYTCGCGYVFAAAVSTSVGCPHCGDSQAW